MTLELIFGSAAALFTIGAVGVVARRNPLVNALSLVMMSQSAVLIFLASGIGFGKPGGYVLALVTEVIMVLHLAISLPLAIDGSHSHDSENGDGDHVA